MPLDPKTIGMTQKYLLKKKKKHVILIITTTTITIITIIAIITLTNWGISPPRQM